MDPEYSDGLAVHAPGPDGSPGAGDGRRWTVMVFMVAETVGGNAPLIEAAKADLAEMTAVRGSGSLTILVQIHGEGVPQRYHIGEEEIKQESVPDGQRDTASGRALAHFIRWSLLQQQYVPHRPGDYSMLVLWGHAYEFAIGPGLASNGSVQALDFVRLGGLLGELQDDLRIAFPGREPPKLDVIGFDACDVATVEIACQLARFAKYLLGSQIGVPIPGWPYDRILGRLKLPIGRLMGAAEFGAFAVRRYCQSYRPTHRHVSLTLLDLQQAPELFARTEVLATVLDLAIARDPATRRMIAGLFSRAQTAPNKPYVDVADLCLNLVRESGDALVVEAAGRLGDFLLSPAPEKVGKSEEGDGRPFVVEHGRNAGATAKLNGISIYAPHVALSDDLAAVHAIYLNFEFVRETQWSRLVHALVEVQ
jgi:Clostripain family